MAKTRRTKIIIEETLGENKDTKVFVNGELYQELEDDNKDQSKAKKKTTSSKKGTSKAKSSEKSKSTKTKTDSNSKTINTKSKNKATKSNKKTTTKKKSTKAKKNNETKEVKDKNIIELLLLDESKEIENKGSINNESEKEGTSASFLDEKREIVEIKDASIVPLNNEISELKSNDNKKEIIENVEIIDPKKEEIIEKEEEKKLDILEAKVIKKEDLEKDNQVNNEEEKAKEKIKEETETIREKKEQEKESSSIEEKSEETIKNNDFAFVNKTEENVKEDSTPSKANITVVKENKSQDTKENKSFLTFITSKKGLIIGASLLAILLVVLIPVTLYYQKVNSPFIRLEEIKEEEIDKTKFKTSESFINDLTNLSFDFEDFNNNYLSSFNYSNSNDVYHYENSLTTNYGATTSNETKETVSFNEETSSYTLTTSTLEDNIETSKGTKEIKSEEVKNNVRDYLTSFYSDYLYLESKFVKNYLDIAKEKYALKYYYIRESDSYRIMLGDETFVLAFNKYGLVTNMKVGITLPKKVSQTANFTSPIPLYYSIDATYEFLN